MRKIGLDAPAKVISKGKSRGIRTVVGAYDKGKK